MTVALDTNVLVRYLFQDPQSPEQVLLARRTVYYYLETSEQIFISDLVLSESLWVLSKIYKLKKQLLLDLIKMLLSSEIFTLQSKELISEFLPKFKNSKADFSDFLIYTISKKYNCRVVLTFDKKASKETGMKLVK